MEGGIIVTIEDNVIQTLYFYSKIIFQAIEKRS